MTVYEVRQRLVEEQERTARGALASPAAKDAYAYGWACGVYAGLGKAIAMFDEMVDDRERAARDL